MSMPSLIRQFTLALQFLTLIRVRVNGEVTEKDLRDSTYFFPVIGLALGLSLAVLARVATPIFPWAVVAALVIVGLVLLTGALHLDGWADVCDGFYAGKTREDVLRIMRDPHIGTMGVVGLICLLGLKYVALLHIGDRALAAIVAAPIIGRSAMVMACVCGSYAREDGKAKVFIGQLDRSHAVVAVVLALAACAALGAKSGFVTFVLASVWFACFLQFCSRRIGGLTGDTLGALNETTELLVWLVVCGS